MVIKLENINKNVLGKDKIIKEILKDLSFEFDNGLYVIKGDNGVGKTTLLYILALLDTKFSGTYFFNEDNTHFFNRKYEEKAREKISLLFSKGNLLNHLTVKETRTKFLGKKKDVIDLGLNLPDDQLVLTLSGGEEILLALAIDLSLNKELFLLDEVTAMLDEEHFKKVMEVLSSISEKATVILVSHDPRSFNYGKLLELKDGKLFESR